MKRITARLAVVAAGLAVPAAIATSALADNGPSVPQAAKFAPQTATQTNSTDQNAKCDAQSNQWAPSSNSTEAKDSQNSNNGNVTQAPQSTATCVAANTNTTTQAISQKQQQEEQQQKPQKDEQQDPSAG